MDQFSREIAGALKATIKAHGPIDLKNVSSATKRIESAIRGAAKRERDIILKNDPKLTEEQINRLVAARPELFEKALERARRNPRKSA